MRQLVVVAVLGSLLSSSAVAIGHPFDARASRLGTGSKGCKSMKGWDAIAARNPRYVIFGEGHGTQEAPNLFGSAVCDLAERGKSILVAVELYSTSDATLQAAWNGPDKDFRSAVLKDGWAGRDDGVASVALLDMLCRLHKLRSDGRHISVVAFSGSKDDAQRRRFSNLSGQDIDEAASAENISTAAKNGRYDYVMVLVGNVHARKLAVLHRGESFSPMAVHLKRSGRIVTLNMVTSGGFAWNCTMKPNGGAPAQGALTSDMMECGSQPISKEASFQGLPVMGLGALPGMEPDPNYDGFFWVGTVSPSPPAAS